MSLAGSLLFSLNSSVTPFLWTIGYILLASGGTFITFSMFTLSMLVSQKWRALAFAIIIGALDASALVLYILNEIFEATNTCTDVLFGCFSLCSLALLIASPWLFYERKHKKPAVLSVAEEDPKQDTKIANIDDCGVETSGDGRENIWEKDRPKRSSCRYHLPSHQHGLDYFLRLNFSTSKIWTNISSGWLN